MNNKNTISKAIYTALFSAAMLFATTSIFAQVKIGSRPTVINPANNLEVESTDPLKKVSIDKTTGKVTIADGSQGVNRVLTSDPNGVATWETPKEQNTDVWVYAKQTGEQPLPQQVLTTLQFQNEIYDRGNNYDPSTGTITVTSSGIYQLGTGVRKLGDATGYFNLVLVVTVNGAIQTTIYEDGWPSPTEKPRALGSITLQLNANDVVHTKLYTSYNSYTVNDGYLTFIKLSK